MTQSTFSIQLNGQMIQTATDSCLQDLLNTHFDTQARYVVAVNGVHIASDLYTSTTLQTGDVVDTFQAIVGG